ncbi:ABC transporter ATP-binding protein [Govanella unica]|uniref:ABC transporter ATP-binding protein n=1 Tax=Govanella unica TaxID=2975056 RepID=A0A9X3Z798_9PROT|nr:ABC transporter ATP-binding protein [Govania unica]MDA5193922.1 ABC transporter ATP-binding protein [Govania unica]
MIAVDQLSVTLGARQVLEDVSFNAPRGVVTGLLGPNGAGKTTALRALLGLVPEARGHVLLGGVDIRSQAAAERARQMAYLPQGGVVHWPVDVETLVTLGRHPHRTSLGRLTAEDRAAIKRAMAETDVLHLRDRPVTQLSGGERMRALLARALATEARVLLADEPVAALDPLHVLSVMTLFERLAAEGRTVVVVLHDLALAARFCRHLVLLDNGRVAASGKPADVLTPKHLAAVYGVRLVGDLGAAQFDFAIPPE